MKLIPLSVNKKRTHYGKYSVQVDDEDYDWLMKYKWSVIIATNGLYAAGSVDGKNISMHRFILGITDRKLVADHVDKNGLNNQRSNLRIATWFQNNSYRQSAKNSSSKYLGVSRISKSNKWKAAIGYNNQNIYLGVYSTEIEAAKVYDKKSIELHGEFATLNFK